MSPGNMSDSGRTPTTGQTLCRLPKPLSSRSSGIIALFSVTARSATWHAGWSGIFHRTCSPTIFECLYGTAPGKGGEIQLTDALKLLLAREPIHGVILRGKRHDIGNPIDWLKTNLIFAARDEAMRKQIAPLVRALLES